MHESADRQGLGARAKALYKRAVRRAFRAGLVDVEARLDALAERLDEQRSAVWRGSLAAGAAVLEDGREVPSLTAKYHGELSFWVNACRDDDPAGPLAGDYEGTFGRWQRDRLLELGRMLDLEGEAALKTWCAERHAVEIGAGPYPLIAVAQWCTAVACDPLADGYVAESLLPTDAHAGEIVYIAAPGERVPLPTRSADLVVIENCLDHVEDPARVMREIRRLLRPGGLCWMLCDLKESTDHMHPHAFSEDTLRALFRGTGFDVVRDRVDDHRSHPEAYGELRALLRRAENASTPHQGASAQRLEAHG
jgi:SAM-dependent methyltransferase